MDYESKYNELVEAARAVVEGNPGLCDMNKRLGRVRDLLPEKESEDERIVEEIKYVLQSCCADGYYSLSTSDYNKYLAWLEKQKEQKPAEWNDTDMKEARNNLISVCRDWEFGKQTTLLPIVAIRARYFLEHLTEPKPAEWSEDFEDNIRNLLHDKLTGHSEDGSMSWTTLIDDKTLKDIVNGIWFYVGKEALKYPNKELSQPEWSEEDEEHINAICRALDDNIANIGFYTTHALCFWLKSLRPRPHWKPSEEQMAALFLVSGVGAPKHRGNLKSLYNDLKKLI